MTGVSEAEDLIPDRALTNFASWYRSLTQRSPEIMQPLFDSLSDAIDGFVGLKLVLAGDSRILFAGFRRQGDDEGSNEVLLRIENLSEGQRCLIALFTILHVVDKSEMTLCFDEPDNFVALRELQPWLNELRDRLEEGNSQCLIASHHPEFINELAVDHGVWFARVPSGPTRIEQINWSTQKALTPAEIVARGWES
jgi:predicted ATPase